MGEISSYPSRFWILLRKTKLCSNLLQSYAKLSARLDKVMVSFALISVLGNLLLFDTTNMTIYDLKLKKRYATA